MFYISVKYHDNILKGFQVMERNEIASETIKGNISESMKARVVILVRDILS